MAKEFILWSETAIGSIYKDDDGEMYVYDKHRGIIVGLSDAVKGKIIRVKEILGEEVV
jgi:hypothetical protein